MYHTVLLFFLKEEEEDHFCLHIHVLYFWFIYGILCSFKVFYSKTRLANILKYY